MLRRRAAAEKPPLSTTLVNTVRLVSRSMAPRDYPISADDPSYFSPIIIPRCPKHLPGHGEATFPGPLHPTEDGMVEIPHGATIGLLRGAVSWLPSRIVIKRFAFGLALAAGIAGATAYGYRYWTVGQYPES